MTVADNPYFKILSALASAQIASGRETDMLKALRLAEQATNAWMREVGYEVNYLAPLQDVDERLGGIIAEERDALRAEMETLNKDILDRR